MSVTKIQHALNAGSLRMPHAGVNLGLPFTDPLEDVMTRIHRIICFSLLILGFSLCSSGHTQGFPERPVTLIVPFPAGGSADISMRVLAEILGKQLNTRVVVENKPGAAGTVGPASMAASARPDGYTISQMVMPVLRYPHMQRVGWEPLKDFTWIIGISSYTYGVVVRADAPWKTWSEFIAYAKSNPEKVSYGSPGQGSTPHMIMEQIAARDGVKWIHVPYKGVAEATAALMGGHITASADSFGWAEHIQSGRFRLLVSWAAERQKRWPDTPTLKELGYKFVTNSPYGIGGPKGMDPKRVKILHDAIKKAIEDPAYQRVLERFDLENYYLSTEDYTRHVKVWFDEERANVERIGMGLGQ